MYNIYHNSNCWFEFDQKFLNEFWKALQMLLRNNIDLDFLD